MHFGDYKDTFVTTVSQKPVSRPELVVLSDR
jgi:hypothetical protein